MPTICEIHKFTEQLSLFVVVFGVLFYLVFPYLHLTHWLHKFSSIDIGTMSQTTTRPRREGATINKSYNDSVDLNSLDYDSLNSVSTANSTQLSGSTTSGSRKKNQTSTSGVIMVEKHRQKLTSQPPMVTTLTTALMET